MRLIGVLLVFAGCSGPMPPITPDGPPPHDGPPPVGGLTVSWNADPGLPGPVTDNIVVTEATFQVDYVYIESDVGSPEKTTHSRFQLRWAGGMAPAQDSFPDAPAARYQNVVISLRSAGPQPTYEIKGNWSEDGGTGAGSGGMRQFRVTDSGPMILLQTSIDKTLPAGGSVLIPIKVDLKDLFDDLDFKSLPVINGELVVEGGPPLAAVRKRIAKVFDPENDN
jgi:hypothetical protein